MAMTPGQRALRGRLGGLATAARHDGRTMTSVARATYRDSFRAGHECASCGSTVIPPGLSESEVQRRADALFRGHMARLAYASSLKRSRKAAAAGARLPTATRAASASDERLTTRPAA
jgi:hypothetical protein